MNEWKRPFDWKHKIIIYNKVTLVGDGNVPFLRLDFSDLDFLTLLCLNVHLVLILYSIYVGAVNWII